MVAISFLVTKCRHEWCLKANDKGVEFANNTLDEVDDFVNCYE